MPFIAEQFTVTPIWISVHFWLSRIWAKSSRQLFQSSAIYWYWKRAIQNWWAAGFLRRTPYSTGRSQDHFCVAMWTVDTVPMLLHRRCADVWALGNAYKICSVSQMQALRQIFHYERQLRYKLLWPCGRGQNTKLSGTCGAGKLQKENDGQRRHSPISKVL